MRGRLSIACAALAIGWGVVLLVGAFTYPAYRGGGVTVACPGCPPEVTSGTRTLVEVNGPAVLVPVAVPLLGALAVSGFLVLTSATGSARASLVAWLLILVLGAFALVSMFSIGSYVLPVVLLLAAAALLAPRVPRGVGTSA